MMRDSRHPADARRTLLRLTDAGRAEHQAIMGRLVEVQKLFCGGIPPGAFREFDRLTRLVARLPVH
jgi:DNA-binding MarR family transcriptional regulator